MVGSTDRLEAEGSSTVTKNQSFGIRIQEVADISRFVATDSAGNIASLARSEMLRS